MREIFEMPISKVLLTEDRAFVTRSFKVESEIGLRQITLSKVSPILVDKSLLCRVNSSFVSVLDIRVRRRCRMTSEFDSAEAREVQDKVDRKRNELAKAQAQVHALEQETSMLQKILKRWLHDRAEDVLWERGALESWRKDFQKLKSRHQKKNKELAELRQSLVVENVVLVDLQKQLDVLTTVSDEVQAHLELDIEVTEPGSLDLEIEYCVPGACWRPTHIARQKEKSVVLSSQACVWQNTGEDWKDVALVFSTQRASLGMEPPHLLRDILQLQKKATEIVLETREEAVKVLQKPASRMPGIEDGGEIFHIEAEEPVSVYSNGRPHRVDLFEFETAKQSQQILMAELSACVFMSTTQKNESSRPLLAGPVQLIKSSGLVGQSHLDFTAAGQGFQLNWGPQKALSVSREKCEHKEDSSLLTGWKSQRHSVEVHLSNLGNQVQSFEVIERIPVSEIKQLKIQQEPKKTSDAVTSDENGFVKWDVELGPKEVRTLELSYMVQKKRNVEGKI